MPNNIPIIIITIGILIVLFGIIWLLISKFIPIGKLPGDIVIKKPNFSFYFPLATSIIISIILSILLTLIIKILTK